MIGAFNSYSEPQNICEKVHPFDPIIWTIVQCIVSHNSLQPLRHVGSDLQAVLMNSTAAAKTSATPAAVLFCLVKVECLGVLEFSVGAYMRK